MYYELTSLERGGNKLYFISLGLARYPNPRLQIQDNNIRIPPPHGINLTPEQRFQIQLLCDERLPPHPEIEPPLIDEDDNELEDEVEMEQQAEQNAGEVEEQRQHLQPYQRTIYYQNELTQFEEVFQQWVNEQYEREQRNFEQHQELRYDEALLL